MMRKSFSLTSGFSGWSLLPFLGEDDRPQIDGTGDAATDSSETWLELRLMDLLFLDFPRINLIRWTSTITASKAT